MTASSSARATLSWTNCNNALGYQTSRGLTGEWGASGARITAVGPVCASACVRSEPGVGASWPVRGCCRSYRGRLNRQLCACRRFKRAAGAGDTLTGRWALRRWRGLGLPRTRQRGRVGIVEKSCLGPPVHALPGEYGRSCCVAIDAIDHDRRWQEAELLQPGLQRDVLLNRPACFLGSWAVQSRQPDRTLPLVFSGDALRRSRDRPRFRDAAGAQHRVLEIDGFPQELALPVLPTCCHSAR